MDAFLLGHGVDQKILTKNKTKQNKKQIIPEFYLILILCLQVMHDFVHLHCSIG